MFPVLQAATAALGRLRERDSGPIHLVLAVCVAGWLDFIQAIRSLMIMDRHSTQVPVAATPCHAVPCLLFAGPCTCLRQQRLLIKIASVGLLWPPTLDNPRQVLANRTLCKRRPDPGIDPSLLIVRSNCQECSGGDRRPSSPQSTKDS